MMGAETNRPAVLEERSAVEYGRLREIAEWLAEHALFSVPGDLARQYRSACGECDQSPEIHRYPRLLITA